MKLRINEATLPDWQDSIMDEVRNVLNNNHIYGDIYEDKDFSNDNSFMLCVDIMEGDWKHDHARTDYLISDLLGNYDNIEITNMGEELIGDETDGDWYSAKHRYMIIRYEDNNDFTYDDIDNMQLDIAFAESVNNKSPKKSLSEEIIDDRYEYIKSKTVLDSDGWQTEYTMYYDWEDGQYIFIFGDSDLYDPTNESPDWECDTEEEANEWFDSYTGFDDEEDFDECYYM